MQKLNKTGSLPIFAVVLLALLVVGVFVVAGATLGWIKTGGEGLAFFEDEQTDQNADLGEIVESLTASSVNRHTLATEGSDDLEFWDKGADIKDTKLSARETLDFSSGSVTDTSIAHIMSGYGPGNMDVYFEGSSNYYDEVVSDWSIIYNEETGKGKFMGPGPSGSVEMVDIGTFADIDAPEELDTGLLDNGDGTVNYTESTGDGTVYIRLELGNDEVDSEIRDAVFCFGDEDGDLDGDEITAMTITKYTGDSIGSINSNLLPLFTQAAGTGGYACTPIGDIVGLKKGVYQIDLTIDESATDSEDFEFGIDDLGGWAAREYPSANLKATNENVQIVTI